MTSAEIEIAVIRQKYPPRQWMVIPNASWGLGLGYEADLLVISKSGYASEIEIKISVADFKKDLQKEKFTYPPRRDKWLNRIKQFYYAFPAELKDKILPLVPDFAGVITVRRDLHETWYHDVCDLVKPAQIRTVIPFSQEQLIHAGMLMQMRYWDLRENTLKYRHKEVSHG